MFNGIDIFLNTRGRANNQVTLNQLPDFVLKNVVVTTNGGDEEEVVLKKNWGSKVKEVISLNFPQLEEVRQYCIESLTRTDYVIFMDDNINFHVKAPQDHGDPWSPPDTPYPHP